MLLNVYFYQQVSAYFDLAFAIPFGEEGVDSEISRGGETGFVTTYSNNLKEIFYITKLGGSFIRVGDSDVLSDSGDVIYRTAFGELDIRTDDPESFDLSQAIDGARFNFTDGDDIVPLNENLVISQSRNFSTIELIEFDSDIPLEFDFGSGTDRVSIDALRSDVQITANNDDIEIITSNGTTGTLRNLEILEFQDGSIAFDIPDALSITFDDGSVLQNYVYPLYAASLDRDPDEQGLRFWSDFANSDTIKNIAFDASLGQSAAVNGQVRLAAEFVLSPEFNTPDTQTRDGFVRKLYSNFLDRDTPDTAGFNFWTDVYDRRLNDEIASGRLPEGVTIFDSDSMQFVDISTEQWAKAWMLRDFASHRDIFERIEDNVSIGLFVADVDMM